MGLGCPRYFYFTDTFIIFMKELGAEKPYFVLKIDNDDILERIDEELYTGPTILDYSKYLYEISNSEKVIKPGEYKFYVDEEYEYYYSAHKTDYVLFFDVSQIGGNITAEWV